MAAKLDTLHPLGGERRLAHWKATAETGVWSSPRRIREALAAASRVRMVLATPAVFRDGWKPGWLNDELVGTPPGANVAVKLVGISIQRWRAVSGWSLLNDPPHQRPGPKPVKRLVPAGGVYFFEAVDGKASDLADRWLESVSDDEQDRRDGFGLAVWGTW
jgi:CRISPR-associated protein Cmr3